MNSTDMLEDSVLSISPGELDLVTDFATMQDVEQHNRLLNKFVNYVKVFGVDRSVLSLGADLHIFEELGIRIPSLEDFDPRSPESNRLRNKLIAGCESSDDNIFKRFFNWIKEIVIKLKNFVVRVLKRMIGFVMGIWHRVTGVVGSLTSWLKDASKQGVEQVPVDNVMFDMIDQYRKMHADDQNVQDQLKKDMGVCQKVIGGFKSLFDKHGGKMAVAAAAADVAANGGFSIGGAVLTALLEDKGARILWRDVFGRAFGYAGDPRYRDRYTDENFYGANAAMKKWYEAKNLFRKKYPTYEERYAQMNPDDALGKIKAARIDELIDNNRKQAWNDLANEINGLIDDFTKVLNEANRSGNFYSAINPSSTLGHVPTDPNARPAPTATNPNPETGRNDLTGATTNTRVVMGMDDQYQNAIRQSAQTILTVLRGLEEQIRVYQGKASVSAKMVYSSVRDQLDELMGSTDATNPIKVIIFNKVMGKLRETLRDETPEYLNQMGTDPINARIKYVIQPNYTTVIHNQNMSEYATIAQSNIGNLSLTKNVEINNASHSIRVHIFDDDIVRLDSVNAIVFTLRVNMSNRDLHETVTNLRKQYGNGIGKTPIGQLTGKIETPEDANGSYSAPADNLQDMLVAHARADELRRTQVGRMIDTLSNITNVHVVFYKRIDNRDVTSVFKAARRKDSSDARGNRIATDVVIPSDVLLPGSGIFLPRTTAERLQPFITGNGSNRTGGGRPAHPTPAGGTRPTSPTPPSPPGAPHP